MNLLRKSLALVTAVTMVFGSFQIPARAADDSLDISSYSSSYLIEDEMVLQTGDEIEDEDVQIIDKKLTDDSEVDSSDIQEDALVVDDIIIEDSTEDSVDNIEETIEDITEDSIEDNIEENIDEELPDDFYTEYPIGGVIDEEPLEKIESVSDGQIRLFRAASLAAEYITPDLPPLRRQNPYGTCWAFATTALAEINLMKNGYMSDPDMSELHLAYFTYNTVVDPLGGTEGDDVIRGAAGILNFGGRTEWGLNTYARWIGVADEETAKYSLGARANSTGLNSYLAYEDAAHIVNIYEEPIEHDASVIERKMHSNLKQLIVDCGAIGVDYYAYNSMSAATSDAIYNVKTNAYYNPNDPGGTNHAIVFVGWDDNFPRTNFAQEAPGDGAFLVRNSWMVGTGSSSDYTYAGYFWMSYYEASLSDYAFAADFALADNYENNYQYDAGLTHGGLNLSKAANIFTTHAYGGEQGERLEAVSFYTLASNINYTIDIYTNLKNLSDPVSGDHISSATTKGTTTYAGMYNIELNEPVIMPADTTFSVVVSVRKGTSNTSIGLEHNLSYGTINITPGQSFIYSGGRWLDLTNVYNCGNLAIKAYTNNVVFEEEVGPVEDNGDQDEEIIIEPKKIDISELSVEGFRDSFEYNGQECRQSGVKIYMLTDSEKIYLTEGEDYTVTYDTEDLVSGGIKSVTYTGIGNYTGSLTKTYRLNSYNLSKDADRTIPCISVAFENEQEPDDDGIYSFYYEEGGVFPDPQITFTQGTFSQKLVKDVDYSISYYNNTDLYRGDDPDLLPRITISGKGNFIRSFNIYFNILPYLTTGQSKYVVTFDGNGAIKGTVSDMIIGIDENVELNANKYMKTGYAFMGWAVSNEAAEAGVVTYKNKEIVSGISANLTLYAVWRREFTVTYDTKGGMLPEGVAEQVTYTFGDVLNFPTPVKVGYSFGGWFTDDTYKEQILGIKSRTFGDYNLIARWIPYTYLISYNGNGSTSGTMAVQSGTYAASNKLSDNQFEKKGYKFVGWNTVKNPSDSNPGTSYADGETVVLKPVSKNVIYILYAQWEKIE